MNLEVSFSQEPLLLVADDKFPNQSMLALSKSQRVLFGSQIPANIVNNEDHQLDWISTYISDFVKEQEILFLVIQQNFIGTNTGIRLISHLRLSEDEKINRLPIIILTDREIDKLVPKSHSDWQKIAPLFSLGVRSTPEQDKEKKYTKNDSLLIQEIEKLYTELTKDGKNEVNLDQFTEYENPEIPVGKPTTSSHQVTNDWGAYRLIQAAGLRPTHEYSKHSYFKYLQRSASTPNPVDKETFKEKINRNIRVLLIDDNHDKGWKDSIELIMNECLLVDDCSATVDTRDYADDIDHLLLKPENGKCPIDEYDFVYLDLRLPKNQANRGNPTPDNGKAVLKEIKAHNPTIPVIMFTASTKATNMDDLYEMGVDGYFVKESPETRNDPNFSKSNLEGFVKTTRNCLKKGKLLQPYWKRIEEIKKSNLIKGNERDIDGVETKFEERIIERLTMFVGLLKKAYEQTDFDRNTFFYDEYETAFLTLWSVFNELSECYFSKIDQFRPFEDKDNADCYIFLHPNLAKIEVCNWFVTSSSGTQEQFIDHTSTPLIQGSSYKQYNGKYIFGEQSSLKFGNNSPYYYFGRNPQFDNTKKPYSQALQMQIAFILYKKLNRMRWQDRNPLLESLYELNKLRNKLYLTHGEDVNTGEFTKTLSDVGTKITPNEIYRLFDLIYVTTTGRQTNFN